MSKLSKRAITLFVIATMILSMLSAFIAVPVMADHTSTATVAFTGPTEVGVVSSLDVVVTNVGPGPISTVKIDFSGTGFTSVGAGALPGTWTGIVAAGVITYTGDTIASSGSETFQPVVTNPLLPGVATNPVVKTTDDGVKATLTTGATGVDDIYYIADIAGVTGNLISIAYVDPGAASSSLTVTVLVNAISVSLATDAGSVITSTTTLVVAAINADAAALLLVDASALTPGLMVTGIGGAPQFLSGGTGPTTDYATPVTGTLTITAVSSDEFTIDYVLPVGTVDYGDILTVIGSGVTAGSEVIVYWDYAFGTLVHPLNNTEGNPDGSYDLEVTVPSDLVGDHYLWVKDVATGATVKSEAITMIPKITLSPSSGLENDDITIKGYGFSKESDIEITFEVIALKPLSEDGGVEAAETDDLGYFEYKFEVDTDEPGEYDVTAMDEAGKNDLAIFKLGAAISLDIDEGPTGTIVTVDGRGWTWLETIIFREKTSLMVIRVVDDDPITVGTNGQFSADIIIPEFGNEGDYKIEAYGSISFDTSSDGFELTGLPEIVVTPTYGTPGKTITVKGYNFTQIAGTEVELYLVNPGSMELVTAETESDGTFEDTFISPAVEFITYDVEATDYYGLIATDPFKVGLIALIINPVYGEAGTELFITGIGFANGDYNVSFGVKLYEEYGTGVDDGAISDYFFVPNVVPGIYDIIITDEDGNEMPVEFRVTAVTDVTLDPAMAPNKYNVTLEGCNFADEEDTVEFVLWNATDEWNMDVKQMWDDDDNPLTPNEERDAETCDDGNFTAYWFVLDEDTLSLGDYTINVTGHDDFFVQVPFSVVEARVSVTPRKPLFDRGDTIQFDVKNDFDFDESYMKIWDPDDNLYWETQEFALWTKAGDIYTVPYYMQTSNMNPMELSQDAPLGEWFWVFYETGTTQLVNGTFEVGPSAESLITEQIQALSEELGIDIDTLQTYIDAKIIDLDDTVSNMAEDIASAVSGMEDDISGLSEDLDDAVTGMQDDIDDMGTKMDSIETMVDDISGTSTAAQEAANDAKNAADQSLEAAEKTQQQTSGLQGLVYGAIAASLIAALAAIVSLMQISRRIAG